MKKVIFICAALLCAGFAGCRKIVDDMTKGLPKFECTVNGVEYRSPKNLLFYPPSDLARPIFHENNYDGIFDYSWFTELGPVAEDSADPLFTLRFYLYLDEPLRVGEKYTLDPPEDWDKYPETWRETVSHFESSHATLVNSHRTGKGTVEITEYNPASGLVRGTIEAEVPLASEGDEVHLIKGKFTSRLQKNR